MNTTEFLTISSAIVPERLAMVVGDRRTTYEELNVRVNRLANGFSSLGMRGRDRVAVLQVNCAEHIETYFAAARLDAVYVPLHYRARADELVYMINDAAPTVLLVGQRYVDLVRSFSGRLESVEHYVALEAPTDGWHFYDDLIGSASDDERFPEGDGDDLTMILFTAGTTGAPKGVMLSHDSFSSYILSNVMPADPEIVERNILTVPLYHIAGVQAVMAAIYGGRTLIVQGQFEPKQWLELAERERANRAMMVPTMIKRLMDHPDFHKHDLSSLEVITYGAAPMPREVIERAIREFPGARFINAFGQTETASTITMLPPEDHVLEGSPEEIEKKLRRLTSIGTPLDDVEVQIVDEEGTPVPVGQVGEIVARGQRMMAGYWHQEAATRDAIRSGWVYTGDLGYWDEDDYIYLSGRAKDFIKRGGEMISPEEVEQVLMSHPQVDDAAVIGVADIQWGEEVRAVVVRRSDQLGEDELQEHELIEYCREKLSGFKRPRSIVFTDELPRNVMGKVMKRDLREEYGYPVEARD
ncbi:MAG: long-chain-fatty-acid--CoA ligase [Chloroflexi bacterium]|nr:long-chain-fatty-acid--CoA ligase [Chloroflexota bacterium]